LCKCSRKKKRETWLFALVGILTYSSPWRLSMPTDGTSNKYGNKVGLPTCMPSDFLDNKHPYSEHQYHRTI
jgi:hypothetical protein